MTTTEPTNHDLMLLLKPHGKIAVPWCIDDVLSLRPDLTREQAWEVLERCRDKHDAQIGINWGVLATWADILFPTDPTDSVELTTSTLPTTSHEECGA